MKLELDDWLLIGGCVLISLGAGMIYIPAGMIAAGVALIGFGFLVGRKKANDGAVK